MRQRCFVTEAQILKFIQSGDQHNLTSWILRKPNPPVSTTTSEVVTFVEPTRQFSMAKGGSR
jgi:hypothetical protein